MSQKKFATSKSMCKGPNMSFLTFTIGSYEQSKASFFRKVGPNIWVLHFSPFPIVMYAAHSGKKMAKTSCCLKKNYFSEKIDVEP